MQNRLDLSGRAVLVTGASAGLGLQFARALAKAGAKVALAARRLDVLEAAAAKLRAEGAEAIAVAMDVTDEASVIAGFDAAQARLGPIETVVANAGGNARGKALDIAAADVARVLALNVQGVFLTAREGARRMIAAGSKASGRGRVIIISSIGADNVIAGATPYSVSKAASAMMGRSLAREWANQGINVNVLCPGYMDDPNNRTNFGAPDGEALKRFPRRRLVPYDALDDMLVYLAGDASYGMTGSVVTLDDGQML